MKYYIVALFDKETYQVISPIQKNVSKKFRTARNSPQPFIPLLSIENPNFDKLTPIVNKLIAPYKTFKVDANDFVYFLDQTKSINLKLDNKGYIKTISRTLYDTLVLYGFNVKLFDDNFVFLGSTPYMHKDAKKQTLKLNYPEIYDADNFLKLKINSIEIWKLPVIRKNTPLMSHQLRTV